MSGIQNENCSDTTKPEVSLVCTDKDVKWRGLVISGVVSLTN